MIKIYTPKHTLFAAMILCDTLNGFGKTAKIVDTIDRRDPDLHIIYNAAAVHRLPPNYIVMQTEIPGTHWFSKHYMIALKNAIAVWDYCESNQQSYDHPVKSIVTPGVTQPGVYRKDIPYLFYGWIEGSHRRRRILDELKQHIPVVEVTNMLGPEMWSILKRTEVVINIHYHENSPLELYRLCEAASFGCQTVSEIKGGTAEDIAIVARCLQGEDWSNYDISHLDNTAEIALALNYAGI